MSLERITLNLRKTLAGLMAIWLSGVVFLLCCSTMDGRTVEAEICPLAKISAHCDKDKPNNTASTFAEGTGETAMDCCGFLHAVFDKARKIEQSEKQIAPEPKPAAVKFRSPLFAHNFFPAIAFHSRIPDRQTTFVNNCVFRI